VNVDVFTEGWDEPLIGCVQVLRPTLSVGRWIQMAGRGLRPVSRELRDECRRRGIAVPPKDHVVLLDHGANAHRHGLPTAKRAWSLDPAPAPSREASTSSERGAASGTWTCPSCRRVLERSVPECDCGGRLADVLPRAIDGELVRLREGEVGVLR